MNGHTFDRIFRQATAFVMTALTAASAVLLGDVLSLPEGCARLLSVPRRIEYILGSLVLYLAAAVVTTRTRAARNGS